MLLFPFIDFFIDSPAALEAGCHSHHRGATGNSCRKVFLKFYAMMMMIMGADFQVLAAPIKAQSMCSSGKRNKVGAGSEEPLWIQSPKAACISPLMLIWEKIQNFKCTFHYLYPEWRIHQGVLICVQQVNDVNCLITVIAVVWKHELGTSTLVRLNLPISVFWSTCV